MFHQLITVFSVGVSTLPQRRGTSFVIVAGVACVVAVLLSMLSVVAGQTRMYLSGGGTDHAIILPKESMGMGDSSFGLSRSTVATILDAPGIAKGSDGAPLADAEIRMAMMPPPGVFQESLQVRGIGPNGAKVRDGFRIESGRMLRTGAQELLVGVGAAKVFGVKTGDKMPMPGGVWPIVGTFSSGGDRTEGQFLADVETLLSAAKRPGFGSVTVKLVNPQAFDEMRSWLRANPALAVDAERVSDYLRRTSGGQLAFFTRISYAIGAIMALGALFGATKIMYAAVRARTREIGTLRALGFGSAPVAASVLLEAMLLALIGAAVGAFVAWLVFDGRVVMSGSVFRLHVSAPLAALGLAWGVIIALIGGLFPAIRAAKLAAATALRAT
jgi:putative ABC transport system permease protein